jgi:hypothetical protein
MCLAHKISYVINGQQDISKFQKQNLMPPLNKTIKNITTASGVKPNHSLRKQIYAVKEHSKKNIWIEDRQSDKKEENDILKIVTTFTFQIIYTG